MRKICLTGFLRYCSSHHSKLTSVSRPRRVRVTIEERWYLNQEDIVDHRIVRHPATLRNINQLQAGGTAPDPRQSLSSTTNAESKLIKPVILVLSF